MGGEFHQEFHQQGYEFHQEFHQQGYEFHQSEQKFDYESEPTENQAFTNPPPIHQEFHQEEPNSFFDDFGEFFPENFTSGESNNEGGENIVRLKFEAEIRALSLLKAKLAKSVSTEQSKLNRGDGKKETVLARLEKAKNDLNTVKARILELQDCIAGLPKTNLK